MSRTVGATMIVGLLLAGSAAGQIQVPRRYEIVQITEDPYLDNRPAINNERQIVFVGRLGANEFSDEIFLYDDGELIRLTDDDVRDTDPDINDDGTIVWSRGIGPDGPYGPTLEIVMWQDGEPARLTDNAVDDWVGEINNLGHIVWSKLIRGGCDDVNAVICFYDGSTIEQISDADWSHQMPVINDQGWIAWTRYNFCVEPYYESDILLYVDGATTQISADPASAPRAATINNRGQVAWIFQTGYGHAIQLWEDGATTLFTDWGSGPRLNDRGDICFFRWYDDEDTYQMWLYLHLQDRFYQLSDDAFWNINPDINDAAEVAWASGHFPSAADIRLLRLVPPDGIDPGSQPDIRDLRPLNP